jgi:hypothetical protein
MRLVVIKLNKILLFKFLINKYKKYLNTIAKTLRLQQTKHLGILLDINLMQFAVSSIAEIIYQHIFYRRAISHLNYS